MPVTGPLVRRTPARRSGGGYVFRAIFFGLLSKAGHDVRAAEFDMGNSTPQSFFAVVSP